MFSQFNNHLPISRPIRKYGEEAFRESHRFERSKEKNNVQRRNNSKTLGVSSKRKVAVQTDQTQELNGESSVDITMMATKIYYKIGVSSSRNEAGLISETQEVYGVVAIDMPMMEAMTHNKKGVPSSANATGQSGEKQEIQGLVVDIQKMDVGNPIKIDVIIKSMRHAKKKKVIDDQNAALYAKW